MLDEYLFGTAARISPEAPVMVIRQERTHSVPGGAANVALNLVALGAKATVVGVCGCDAAGDALAVRCQERGTDTELVRDPNRVTTRKTRVLADSAHQVVRVDHEQDDPLGPELEDRLIRAMDRLLADADVLIISDYLKGTLTQKTARFAVDRAAEIGVPTVVNPKPRSAKQYAGASLVSLNRAELTGLMGLERPFDPEAATTLAGQVCSILSVESVLATLGERGMAAANRDGEQFDVPGERVEVYDTAGAGDTVVATVALGMATCGFRREVFELAAATSACVVRKVGVAVPAATDLASL